MKNLNISYMTLDLTPAIPLLNALDVAESFLELYIWAEYYDRDELLDEAMETINKYCPWLWPSIDSQILVYHNQKDFK